MYDIVYGLWKYDIVYYNIWLYLYIKKLDSRGTFLRTHIQRHRTDMYFGVGQTRVFFGVRQMRGFFYHQA